MAIQNKELETQSIDRLTDLPEEILHHIVSFLPRKEIVRTSLLSRKWRFFWKSVPVSLYFDSPDGLPYGRKDMLKFLDTINGELPYSKKVQQDLMDVRSIELVAPYIHEVEISGQWDEVQLSPNNISSVKTAVFSFLPNLRCEIVKELKYAKELLESVAHAQKVELSSWFIECLSLREVKGWSSRTVKWKFVKLSTSLEERDFPGVCSLLQCAAHLEHLVIDWKTRNPRFLYLEFITDDNDDEKKFETSVFNCSLLHLKTIIIHFHGLLSENEFVLPLVTYLLKNAEVLEKLTFAAKIDEIDMIQAYFESFPRSSPNASIVYIH